MVKRSQIKRSQTKGVGGSSRTSVEVLLAENVADLGKQGDIVRVKPGFARNFLLPQGLATVASEHNKLMVERHRKRMEAVEAGKLKDVRSLGEAIGKYSVTLEANANDEGHLYGSIGAGDVSGALKSAGYQVEPDHIKLEGPLRELGMYTVSVVLHEKVSTTVKVWVVPAAT